MTIHEIPEAECRAILARTSIGRLGCSVDDQPYVIPILFVYEPEYVYAFSTLGQKIEWMRQNPKICLQVDEIASRFQWLSVLATGTYEELSEVQRPLERAHARELLEKQAQWWLNAMAERRTRVSDVEVEPIFFRIHIASLSGLQSAQDDDAAR